MCHPPTKPHNFNCGPYGPKLFLWLFLGVFSIRTVFLQTVKQLNCVKLKACLGNTKSGLLVYGLPEAIFAMYIQSQICTGFCYMSLILDINQSQLKTVERKKEERNSNFYLDKNPSGPIIRSCNVALLFKLIEKN